MPRRFRIYENVCDGQIATQRLEKKGKKKVVMREDRHEKKNERYRERRTSKQISLVLNIFPARTKIYFRDVCLCKIYI